MCGIFGFIGEKYNDVNSDLEKMRISLNHRGPDSFKFDNISIPDTNILYAFGHVRLAILDTSDAGSQPMQSRSKRFTIVFNGEIYNFKDLKIECENINPSITWKGHSDTEVILEGFELFGIKEFASKMVGMFAISLWDNLSHKLYLIRDRIGEKPLYYGYQNGYLVFASEIKAFEVHSKFERKINLNAAVGFLIRSYVPNNLSIYENIYKVKPGNILVFDTNCLKLNAKPELIQFWSLSEELDKAKKNPFRGTYEEAKIEFENLLVESIKQQSISDVPYGAFLSGGIDSSLVCSIMKKHVSSDLMTFTIGMPAPGINEAPHAENVAQHINSIHKTKYLNTIEIISKIDDIFAYWDEPFADSSQIPTYFVSKHAREFVTVVLSGDGADEFLYGYPDHKIYLKYKKYIFLSKLKIDKSILWILGFLGLTKNKFYNKIKSLNFLLKLLINNSNVGDVQSNWHNKFWDKPLPINKTLAGKGEQFLSKVDFDFKNVGHYDALSYLPNDILVKVDRAAMAVSLESRAPFLNHKLLEFLIKLPDNFLFHDDKSKKIAKDVLYRYVPEKIVNRPKQGFSIPVSFWLKNDLKKWAETIIDGIPIDSTFWDKQLITNIWNEHQSGITDHPEKIWNILALELFFKRKNLLHHE
jgi:asparagine synthase (glutamine-hydrolysing)